MSFVTQQPAADGPVISNGTFWPDIDPAAVRAATRFDGTVTPERLRQSLINSISSVNAQLSAWSLSQIALGHATLAAVPAPQVDGASAKVHQYRRAVQCMTHAELIERLRDYDTTAKGERDADQLTQTIDSLRRDAAWALNDLRDAPRSTVELI